MLRLLFLFFTAAFATEFQITNREIGEVWIGIQANPNHPQLNNGGFILGAGQTQSVYSPDNWQGRFWARTWCDRNTGRCLTGNCDGVECQGRGGTPPVTLVEITLQGSGNQDYYDISLVDGFNLKATIGPVGGSGNCRQIGCNNRINDVCPNDLKVNTQHGVVACKSSCLQTNRDEDCCRNQHNSASTCHPASASLFKQQCPDAYSYAYDDATSTFTCSSKKYVITFGG